MEITFLGTSGTVPTERRNHSAIAFEYLQQWFLFDCGEGTQRQMRFAEINPMRFDHIFITHLHADHILGIGGLIQSLDFMERHTEVNVYGPKGIAGIIDKFLNLGTFRLFNFRVNVHEVAEGIVLDGGRFRVSCTPSFHGTAGVAYCFEEKEKRTFLKKNALDLGIPEGRLFSQLQKGKSVEMGGRTITPDDVMSEPVPGRKIVYTGDTKPSKKIESFARGADVLIHDATFSEDIAEDVKDMMHSTATEAATVAKNAGVGALYLTHISQRYASDEDDKKLEDEARKIFKNSFMAKDFMHVKIEPHKAAFEK